MRKRRQRQTIYPSQDLDSFLDILTNTVGVLMFIGLFIALLAVEAGTIVRTPLVTESQKYPHFFEVRDNRVTYIDAQEVNLQLDNFISSLPTCSQPNIPSRIDSSLYDYYVVQIEEYNACVAEKIERLRLFRTKTDYYTVSFVGFESLVYEPRESVNGESIEELTQANSEFRRILRKLDNNINYLAFIVRPDSFKAFRMARKQAWKEGFDVGWEPYKKESPIVFGSGGKAIGVQ